MVKKNLRKGMKVYLDVKKVYKDYEENYTRGYKKLYSVILTKKMLDYVVSSLESKNFKPRFVITKVERDTDNCVKLDFSFEADDMKHLSDVYWPEEVVFLVNRDKETLKKEWEKVR